MSLATATPVPAKNRLERFRAIRARLDPSGDPASAVADFYIGGPDAVSKRLAAELAIAPASNHLLVGGVGSGKTTELIAAQRELARHDDILALYIDISKYQDVAEMTPWTIVAQVCLAFAEQLEHIDDLGNPSASDDHQLPVIESVEQVVTRNIRTLLERIRRQCEHVVVLLDGLDRIADIEVFEQLVLCDVKSLRSFGIGTVLVGPLRALYGLERSIVDHFDKFHHQAWIDPSFDPARGFLRDVLARRAGEVLDPSGVEFLVLASGGVLRDLLSLAQAALVEAYMHGSERVGQNEVDAAVDAFGRKHMQGLRAAEIEVLQRVRKHGTFIGTSEDDLALLMTRRVLEYRDPRPRYTVHPTIDGLLRALEAA